MQHDHDRASTPSQDPVIVDVMVPQPIQTTTTSSSSSSSSSSSRTGAFKFRDKRNNQPRKGVLSPLKQANHALLEEEGLIDTRTKKAILAAQASERVLQGLERNTALDDLASSLDFVEGEAADKFVASQKQRHQQRKGSSTSANGKRSSTGSLVRSSSLQTRPIHNNNNNNNNNSKSAYHNDPDSYLISQAAGDHHLSSSSFPRMQPKTAGLMRNLHQAVKQAHRNRAWHKYV